MALSSSIQARHGHVVVSGGGATGIETAAEVASAYPHIKVHLVTREPVALFLGKSAASSIRRRLLRLGVEILDQTSVTAVRAHSVVIDQGSELACDLCIWTGGFVAPPLAREAGLAVNGRNQMVVDPFLRSISHPEIYAIGFNNYPDDKPLPPYFSGWLGYLIREGFVRLLATAVQHGAIVWPGKGRYERAQHRQNAKAQKDALQLRRV